MQYFKQQGLRRATVSVLLASMIFQPVAQASATLNITKTVDGTGSNGPFDLTISGPDGFNQTAQISGGQTVSFPDLVQGSYTVTESTPNGWKTTYATTAGTGGNQNAVVNLTNPSSVTRFTPTGAITGKVFNDYNGDGNNNNTTTVTEGGVAGATVSVYDLDGNLLTTATTDATGSYSIAPAALTAQGPYRVVFANLPAGYEPGMAGSGTQNGTNVQFVTADTTAARTLNVGVLAPADYCQADPKLVVPIYRNGNPLGGGTSGTQFNAYGIAFSASGTSPAVSNISTHAQTGAIWGQAYQRESKQLFRSAVIRRHDGLGSGGLAGIYRTDMSAATPTTSLFVDLETLGVDFGSIPDNTARGLAAAASSVSVDAAAFPLVGKAGIGGIDLSDDGKTLYVVNLHDRKVYQTNISNPAQTPKVLNTLGEMPWMATDPCTNGVARPWALKQYRGDVYAGVVCSAENEANAKSTSTSFASLQAHVYRYATGAGAWNKVLDVPLDYVKGETSSARHGTLDKKWLAWTDTFVRDTDGGSGVSTGATFMMDSGRTSRPMPILSDLAFDTNGNLILGFMDRGGMMMGWSNRTPDYTSGTELIQYNISGDILRACGDAATGWTLEQAGQCGGVTGGGANNQGPAGGEFYAGDVFSKSGGVTHNETMNGALATLAGSNLVASAAMDPFDIDSGGVYWLSNDNGSKSRAARLYAESGSFSGSNSVTNGTFGKAGAMGDIAVLCDPAPIGIGNRVWDDVDGDGVQDAGEPGINGVEVKLADTSGTVAITTTSGDGNYYFNNLTPDTAYSVTVATLPEGYELTKANAQALGGAAVDSNHALHDVIDSDATLVGKVATIAYTTGASGEHNHGLDFGLTKPVQATVNIINTPPQVDLSLSKIVSQTTAHSGETVVYTLTVTNESTTDATGVKLTDKLPAGVTYSSDDSEGSYDKTSGVWDVGNLPKGKNKVLNITVTVN